MPAPATTTSRARGLADRVAAAATKPVNATGLAAFRILFGLLMAVGLARFLASGWLARFYDEPTFFFRYWGLAWVPIAPVGVLAALHVALIACALALAVGYRTRTAAALFALGFAYVQALDVTNYLNHYVLVVLLAAWCVVLPVARVWSVDARRTRGPVVVPAWVVWALRFQVGVVYVHAGLAKATSDWLLHGQPLNIWLTARTHTPLVGPWLDRPWVALAASWAGFLFDTTIVGWLSWRRSRPWAYVALVGFHALTHVWFNIGMFPFIMTLAALVFFPPGWPRALLRRAGREDATGATGATAIVSFPRPPRAAVIALGLVVAVQVLVPLRHLVYPGDVLWTEEGMRFAWKVMLREKSGAVTYHVRVPGKARELQVSPRRYLSSRQEREMSGQPDLILQLARHIAADLRAQGYGDVEIRVEAWVSLNGRAARLLVDPTRDLARVEDGLAAKEWILPGPSEPPRRLEPAIDQGAFGPSLGRASRASPRVGR